MQPAPQSGVGEEGGELPPTLRIHASQPVEPAASPPPLPPPAPPVRAAPPPIAAASARPLTSPLPEDVPITPEAKTLPGKAVERVEEPPAAPFPSSTLAELYFQQGLADRAAAVYRQLVELEPDNEKARRRLAELEQGDSPALDRATRRQALERTIAGLELLLAAVKRR